MLTAYCFVDGGPSPRGGEEVQTAARSLAARMRSAGAVSNACDKRSLNSYTLLTVISHSGIAMLSNDYSPSII
jgi:hypothetical protein